MIRLEYVDDWDLLTEIRATNAISRLTKINYRNVEATDDIFCEKKSILRREDASLTVFFTLFLVAITG